MAVRKTESRIFGGFEKAEIFGYAKYCNTNDNIVLISSLPQVLRLDISDYSKDLLFNRYYVFVNTENISEPSDYVWTIKFYEAGEKDPFYETSPVNTEFGELVLTNYSADLVAYIEKESIVSILDIPEITQKTIKKILVSLRIPDCNAEISIEHDVADLYQDTELLFADSSDYSMAKAGASISRLIANVYRNYIINCECLTGEDASIYNIPDNLLASVIYLFNYYVPSQLIDEEQNLWESYINNDSITEDLKKTPLGVAQIRPQFISMIIPKENEVNNTVTELVIWDKEAQSKLKYETTVFDNFHQNASEGAKIDIINLLRFPKTSVVLSCAFLSFLKNRHSEWKSLTSDQVLNNPECIKTIVTEYENGPYKEIKEYSLIGRKVFNIMGSPFIQSIAKKFERFKVKVLGINIVPINLQQIVKTTLNDAFQDVHGIEFTYDEDEKNCQQLLSFSTDMFPAYGFAGTVYVSFMQIMRLETNGGCEPAYIDTNESLGINIANSAVHELAHLIGLSYSYADADAGGHVTDLNNYMWSIETIPEQDRIITRVNNGIFIYTVKDGDILSKIVLDWNNGILDSCARGPSTHNAQMVWQYNENKQPGFVAYPHKDEIPGRIANDPDHIYIGEKVCLYHYNFRIQEYRQYYPGWIGQKVFTDEQIRIMNEFVQMAD
jgi:hypothetical protein